MHAEVRQKRPDCFYEQLPPSITPRRHVSLLVTHQIMHFAEKGFLLGLWGGLRIWRRSSFRKSKNRKSTFGRELQNCLTNTFLRIASRPTNTDKHGTSEPPYPLICSTIPSIYYISAPLHGPNSLAFFFIHLVGCDVCLVQSGKGGKGKAKVGGKGKGGKGKSSSGKKAPVSRSMRAGLQVSAVQFFCFSTLVGGNRVGTLAPHV